MNIRFPSPLRPGDRVAVTAFSSGVPKPLHDQLDRALDRLRGLGLEVVEGECLRGEEQDASAPAARRLAELKRFLFDPGIRAILPPWGGERAIELLAGLDFDALSGLEPKWLAGFSDVSTLAAPLTLRAGWATLHGPNLFDLGNPEREFGVAALLHSWRCGLPPEQASFSEFWRWDCPGERYHAQLRVLDAATARIRGRLIGGCLDTLSRLQGTPYFDLSAFKAQPAILYLENCEMNPCELLRALSGLRLAGVLDGLAGLVLGRSSGPDASGDNALSYAQALEFALAGLPYPVIIDADIGHLPPQWTLLNGAWAELEVVDGRARLRQAPQP
ncbi:LD-carboxypeptidase [Xenophilus sp. AP218F]|nr:LD-carboxypeptidase [Xenophilus sp. AP218F]